MCRPARITLASENDVRTLMAKQNDHGKLIAAAAKAALLPLGFRRKGQSRVWISDERSWTITVEFQPSAWEKGTYLNVWPQWLWLRLIGGHVDERVGDFIPFKSAEQFVPRVADLAAQGVQRVQELRDQFRSLSDINSFFASHITSDGFPLYRAAITAGLVGDLAAARRHFLRMEAVDPEDSPYRMQRKAECAALSALVENPEKYRATLKATVDDWRQRLRLTPYPECLEGTDATAAQQ
jgi:hypothetical protein